MVNDPSVSDSETLGQFLHRHRTDKGLDLSDVAEQTKIPLITLKAMEDGEYRALPADAFARGFFSIYARLLEVDVDHVLECYINERDSNQKNRKKTMQTPSMLGEAVSPMAERPAFSPISLMGFSLVVFILLVTGVCWYFSWNPARFLSNQLRSFGHMPSIEQSNESKSVTPPPAPVKENSVSPSPYHQSADKNTATTSTTTWKYTLIAEFQEATKATVVVDEDFPDEMNFTAGQTYEWHPKQSMTLTLPADTKTRLSLNGVIIPLPKPVGGFITVSIPDSVPK